MKVSGSQLANRDAGELRRGDVTKLLKGDPGDHARYGERHSIDDYGIDVEDSPPPVPYHVWYYLPDWGVWLDCVYNDDTGKLEYCDIYM